MKKIAQWLNGFSAIFSAAGLIAALLVLVFGDETSNVSRIQMIIYWAAPVLVWTTMNWMVIAEKRIRLSIEPQHPQEAATVADEVEVASAT